MKARTHRGGWSGGPVRETGELKFALVCFVVGAAAVVIFCFGSLWA